MGAVYQAHDAELGEIVALKVIRPEAMATPAAARAIETRFKRELVLARQVTHENVVRIHDLGEIDGIKYITMEHVEGTELAELLERVGTLSVPRALSITRSIVAGLQAAHAKGVVHRDLKPSNIMVRNEGEAVIMDFGIARSTGAAIRSFCAPAPLPAGVAADTLRYDTATRDGAVVGTLQFMAPEQARGGEVDQRADIYSLGLIVYDMLAGRERQNRAESAIDELYERMEHAPRPIRSLVADVPDGLSRLVARCLDPDPARRFQTTAELAAELDRLDDRGMLRPRVRKLTPGIWAAALVIAMLGGIYALRSITVEPDGPRKPVSVVIADLENRTGDPAFERTLEPTLKRALEGAPFINAYDRNGVDPAHRGHGALDETSALQFAVKEGLAVVLSGAIDRKSEGFEVSVRAVEALTGNVIVTSSRKAANRDGIVEAATALMVSVRNALGDDTSASAPQFAMQKSLSATSLEVVRLYAASQDAASNARFEEARERALKATELDPTFGSGYQLVAVASQNLRNRQDALKYSAEALNHLDRMTEREAFSARGFYYRITGNYTKCVSEYGELINRYPADVVGHNQRALCLSYLRRLSDATSEMQPVVDLLPNRVLFRTNLALYASHAGDFKKGEVEAQTILAHLDRNGAKPDAYEYPTLALSFAQLGQGQFPQAMRTYQLLESLGGTGASLAVSGLADLAIYQGRLSDAVLLLQEGSDTDLQSGHTERAAAKLVSLAYAHLQEGRRNSAIAAARRALTQSQTVKIRFVAARIFIEAGDVARAFPLAESLAAERHDEPRAYAKILSAGVALKQGGVRQAIELLTQANGILDTWIGHFDLGRTYMEDRDFVSADSEFERCVKRRGEALSLFLDQEPTYAYFRPVEEYQRLVRQEIKSGLSDSSKIAKATVGW
jgi:tetratricopeptide (TPR) repeat protein